MADSLIMGLILIKLQCYCGEQLWIAMQQVVAPLMM